MAKAILIWIAGLLVLFIGINFLVNDIKQKQTTLYIEFYKMCAARELTTEQCNFAYKIYSNTPLGLGEKNKHSLEEIIDLAKKTVK